MSSDLAALFQPRSIAIVGASANPQKWGHVITRNVLEAGFGGVVYPVNPKGVEILGLPTYPRLADVPGEVDLAFIGIGAQNVPGALEDCLAIGCRVAVVVTSGFGEIGPEGRERERDLIEKARAGGLRVVGPNCMGVYTSSADLYASIGLSPLRKGTVALLSQSGNVGVALFRLGVQMGLGFHSFIGVGNQADIGFHEYLNYLADDEGCEVIALYLEGLKDGSAFIEAVGQHSTRKPVVVLKGGRTERGQVATRSHTGSLATDDRIFRGLLRQAGGIQVTTFEELVVTCLVLSSARSSYVDNLAVLTDGGGFGVLAVDRSEALGLPLAELSDATRQALAAHLPPYCSTANPVDIGGDADSDPSLFATCTRICLSAPEVDALLVTGIFGGYRMVFAEELSGSEVEAGRQMGEAIRESGKPVVVQSLWARDEAPALQPLREGSVPVVESLELSLQGLRALRQHGQRLRRDQEIEASSDLHRIQLPTVTEVLDEAGLYEVLMRYDVSVPGFRVAESVQGAVEAAAEIGYPVVVKRLEAKMMHKTEAGGVVLNVRDDQRVIEAFRDVIGDSSRVLITEQIRSGTEVAVGGLRDPEFGPLIMVGLGGLYVEDLNQVAFRRCPVKPADIRDLLSEGQLGQLLASPRNVTGVDHLDALEHLLAAVAQLLVSQPRIAELDLNPVILSERGPCVVDAKMTLVS